MTVAFALTFFVAVLYFNYNVASMQLGLNCHNNNNINNNKMITEGFKSKTSDDTNSSTDEDEVKNGLKDLFAGGPLVKSFNKSRQDFKDIKKKAKAEANMMDLEIKTEERRKRKEKFTDRSSKEEFKPIPMRKFNPADKEDTDLLMVMEHCKDITNRIKYEYEDTRYLKKYIKDKLGDIIELLDLVEDE
jgi:hypothetical protein